MSLTDPVSTSGGYGAASAEFPPVVYVPCAEHVSDGAQARPIMHPTKDGRVALLAYSALDRLHEGIGAAHPWFLVPTSGLEQLKATQGFDLLLLDVLVPEENRTHVGAR